MTEYQVEDPAADALRKGMRVALMAAAAAAELTVRYWRRERVAAAGRAGEEARQTQAAYGGQCRLAELHLASLDDQWLSAASVDDLAHAWEVTRTWAALEPETFQSHQDRIRISVRDRFGLDPLTATSPGSDLADQLRGRASVSKEEPTIQADVGDAAAAAVVVATADGDVAHDVAEEAADDQKFSGLVRASNLVAHSDVVDLERFDALAARCARSGVDDALAQARVTAARSQPYPTPHAVRNTMRHPMARLKRRGSDRGAGADRAERER